MSDTMIVPTSYRGILRLTAKHNIQLGNKRPYKYGVCPLEAIAEANGISYNQLKGGHSWNSRDKKSLTDQDYKLAGIEVGFEDSIHVEFDNPVFRRYYKIGQKLARREGRDV